MARRGLPAGRRRDPARAGRPAGARRGLPRGARAPLVPLREGAAGRRDRGGGARPTSTRAAPDAQGGHDAVGDRGARPGDLTLPDGASDVTVRSRFRRPVPVRIDTPCDLHHAPRTAVTSPSLRANGGDDSAERCRGRARTRATGASDRPRGAVPARARRRRRPARDGRHAGRLRRRRRGRRRRSPGTSTPTPGGQAEIASAVHGGVGRALHDRDVDAAARRRPRSASSSSGGSRRKDSSIDLMSLDPPYIPEFAEAGFLAPVPEDVAERVTEGVVAERDRRARPGTTSSSRSRSGPTPSCSGTGSRSPRRPGWT